MHKSCILFAIESFVALLHHAFLQKNLFYHSIILCSRNIICFLFSSALCKPGEYSPNGLSPCFVCPVGHYSDKLRSITCNKCPTGTTTVNTGADSKYQCGSKRFKYQFFLIFFMSTSKVGHQNNFVGKLGIHQLKH